MSDTLKAWEAWQREVEGPFTATLTGKEWEIITRALWIYQADLERGQEYPKADEAQALREKLLGYEE